MQHAPQFIGMPPLHLFTQRKRKTSKKYLELRLKSFANSSWEIVYTRVFIWHCLFILFRPSKVTENVTSRVSGGEFRIKERSLTLTLNLLLLLPSFIFYNKICAFIMIFTALSFYGLFTAYLLYEEVMSLRLYDTMFITNNHTSFHLW